MPIKVQDNPGTSGSAALKPGNCCSSNNNKVKAAATEDIEQLVSQLSEMLPRLQRLAE